MIIIIIIIRLLSTHIDKPQYVTNTSVMLSNSNVMLEDLGEAGNLTSIENVKNSAHPFSIIG